LHVAWPAPVGDAHGVHDAPHVFGSSFAPQLAPHAWYPALHANPHRLDAQTGCACDGALHVVPHAPQLDGLDVVSTHVEPQSVGALAGQPLVHPLAEHTGVPPLHDVLHEPHVAVLERFASHPSSGLLEQCA
jgi:hypothetical protein